MGHRSFASSAAAFVFLWIAVLASPAVGVASAAPSVTSFTADEATITVPASTTLRAQFDDVNGGSGRIIDVDTGEQVQNCGQYTSGCTAAVSSRFTDNRDRDQHFRAEVYDDYGNLTDSKTVTVHVKRREFAVSLSADKASLTVPESTIVTATVDYPVDQTGYELVIVDDDDTGDVLASCPNSSSSSNTTSCSTQISARFNRDADNARPFHLSAFVRGYDETASNTARLNIPVAPHDFELALSSDDDEIEAPGRTLLHATVNQRLEDTPYTLRIINADTGYEEVACPQGAFGTTLDCQTQVNARWNPYAYDPKPLNYFAKLEKADGTTIAVSEHSVDVREPHVPADLEIPDNTDLPRTATATADDKILSTPLALAIEDDTGQMRMSCGGTYWLYHCSTDLPAGTYRATVRDPDTHELFGASGWKTISDDGTYDDDLEGLDLNDLADRFASAQDICDTLLVVEGTHLEGTSTSDQWNACDAVLAAAPVITRRRLLEKLADYFRRIGRPAAVLSGILFQANVRNLQDSPGSGSYPAASPGTRPLPLFPDWTPSLAGDVDTVLDQNRSRLTKTFGASARSSTEKIVRRCYQLRFMAIAAGQSGASMSECRELPIFVSGDTRAAQATRHDEIALSHVPQWGRLHYEVGKTKNDRDWKDAHPTCQITRDGDNCHEFPFFASQEGGAGRVPTPSLGNISEGANKSQGASYGVFVRRCFQSRAGTPFLVVPAPKGSGIPSLSLCNGA